MKKIIFLTPLILVLMLLASCTGTSTPSADDIATAIAETQQISEIRSAFETATQLAMATDTPEPTSTDTPTPTDTPLPSSTPTPKPPEGMAYVPNFIGMQWDEVSKMFKELGMKKAYYVAAIKWDVDEWSVFEQEPEPGTLVDVAKDRVKVIVAVKEFTPTPTQEKKQGQSSGDLCGGITYAGTCFGNVCYWCENNQLWYWDCSSCGGYCGWDSNYGYYTCFCP
jgi:hypothetical protein